MYVYTHMYTRISVCQSICLYLLNTSLLIYIIKGLWDVTLSLHLLVLGVPVLATCFPVTSPSSHERSESFGRTWRGVGVKVTSEEMTAPTPGPLCSVSLHSTSPLRIPALPGAQRAPLPRRRHQGMSPSLGTTVGKP